MSDFNGGMKIRDIDRIAKKHGIGFKIKQSMQGNYLFSKEDIEEINKIYKELTKDFKIGVLL